MKKCIKCVIDKESSEYHKDKSRKDGLVSVCKLCRKKYQKNNKHDTKLYKKNYRKENSEYIKSYMKKYRKENSEHVKEVRQLYNQNNKERKNLSSREYYYNNKENMLNHNKSWRKTNVERNRELGRRHYRRNKLRNKHIKVWRSILEKSLACVGKIKNDKTIEMLRYSSEDLKNHIESLFIENMSWENHGEWHIDHKIPLSKFKKDTPAHIVNSLENLQPLWSEDNLSKSDRVLEEYKYMEIYINYCK